MKRPKLSGRHPLHVVLRVLQDAPRLRRAHAWALIRAAFRAGCARPGFRLIHFSVQETELHLICEADEERSLSRGMQGLIIRIARGLNRLASRRGKVFADRYDARVLKTPTDVRRALVYVLLNAAHQRALREGLLDVYSSASYFDGWQQRPTIPQIDDGAPPVVPPANWLLTTAWKRVGGPISLTETPVPAGAHGTVSY